MCPAKQNTTTLMNTRRKPLVGEDLPIVLRKNKRKTKSLNWK